MGCYSQWQSMERREMKHTFAFIVLLLTTMSMMAQTEPEYRLELGAGAGLVTYEGDYNDNLLRGMKPMGEIVAKYKLNPRMAWAMSVGYAKLSGTSAKANTWYPATAASQAEYSTSLIDVVIRYEYNFLPFGTGHEYYGAKPFTPFIAIGLGVTYANADATLSGQHYKHSKAAGQLPLGIGVKYKAGNRWNLAAEWSMHFTGNDLLDGVEDPYGIKSSGLFKNTDCYSAFTVTLTYDLWAKCRTCHNDRE